MRKRCQKKTLNCLNPFEVREVLQEGVDVRNATQSVSIPLKSGRCCKVLKFAYLKNNGLNPFEVREVLQAKTDAIEALKKRLNPFEVREVLQEL